MIVEPIAPEIPDADAVRRRLAVVLTEAGVLRAQLRVSQRAKRERERLHQQGLVAEREGTANAR